MKSAEASAKTRQEAIQEALQKLGAELHEVQIEILDEGSKGIFGLGARAVKVRLTLEGEEESSAPAETSEARPRAERPPRGGERPPRAERPSRGGERPPRGGERRPERPPRRDKPTRQGPQKARRERPQQKERDGRREEPRPARERQEPELPPISEDRRQEATALLAEMIEKTGMKATVTSTHIEDGGVRIDVESEDSAILIGRKGRNLQAMQYLINRMMRSEDAPETIERFSVDVERYVERRKDSLEQMALQLAGKAKHTGNEIRVKPLNPQERRIVHLALQDDPDVRTFSLGNSIMRTIVISPRTTGRDQRRSRPRGRGGRRDGRRSGNRRGPSDRREPAGTEAGEHAHGDTTDS